MSVKHYESLPKIHTTYANIIKSLLPIGEHQKVSKEQLPSTAYQVDNLVIDKENLKEYRKICGFYDNGQVPVTYFSVLSQALQMNMMVKEPFPFAMLGLVHVENSVTQHRPVVDSEVVSLSVRFANLRDHDKGQQFDFVTTVKSGDELVWEGSSTYLSRSRKKGENKAKPRTVNPKPEVQEQSVHAIFQVPEDIGRRYAFVSGDFNLIHLHPLSARAFGFPKAIAHGMWSKAKCLAQLQNLPKAYKVDVSFKLPIFLPAEVEFISESVASLTEVEPIAFGLYHSKNDKPHLLGKVYKVEAIKGLFSEEDAEWV